MRILSIDQSTSKCGWAVWVDGELEDYGLIELEKLIKDRDDFLNKDYLERIVLMKEILLDMIVKYNIEVVGMEDIIMTSFGGRSNNNQVDVFKKLAKALGVYECALIERQIAFDTIPAGVWRTGLGLGKKRDEIKANTIEYVNKTFGFNFPEYKPNSKNNFDDTCDAIMIGKYLSNKFSK